MEINVINFEIVKTDNYFDDYTFTNDKNKRRHCYLKSHFSPRVVVRMIS